LYLHSSLVFDPVPSPINGAEFNTSSTETTAIITLMQGYDLCLAWNWEYDADFSHLLEAACQRYGISFYSVKPENVGQVLADLERADLSFKAFFDRASESDRRFQPLVDWASHHSLFCINPQKQTLWAVDKATMHLEFVSHGLDTPHTILLPPFVDHPGIPAHDLSPLGGSFAIKPASMGGGEGVVLTATLWEQVLAVRQQHPGEKYLLQALVTPQMLEGRPAWFRVLVCDGALYPCWWNPGTHIYSPVTAEQRFRFGLRTLRDIASRIAQICRLQLFSTEIAMTGAGRFLVVDYVNDPVDLRLQSRAFDGAPDIYVESIAARRVRLVQAHRAKRIVEG